MSNAETLDHPPKGHCTIYNLVLNCSSIGGGGGGTIYNLNIVLLFYQTDISSYP